MDPSMGEMGSLKVEVADTFSTYNKFLQFFPPTGLSPLHWLDGVSCLAHPSLQQPLSRHYVTFMGSGVKMLVRTALNPCTYAVKGEEELKFQMLYTMDGNNSLKRIVRRTTPEDNNQLVGKTCKLPDSREVDGDKYLNMVQSGKLEKYPLAVVEEILNTFGEDIAGVFDINCKFKTTLSKSLLGPHGDEFKVNYNLTSFLYNNYQQALDILSKSSIGFKDTVYDLSVTDESVFKQWLKEEKEYLMSLQKEPTKETLHMEYWQKLVNVQANRVELEAITKAWEAAQVLTKEQQVVRQIAMENYEKNLKDVQQYKLKLHILTRWTPDSKE
ncbi:hypothetical protein SERLADRAFT_412247 [Serpula lacrymans var. lacrymans S7.9]|uniref:Uncharacterized protein n=1 Tax=Serpula lacrymans var. lacrymans (strain S7.9) TaxID=578457 RepID=F8PEN1_SERL9|nr:uncharacterized protein SERLADRAFT_412247 [Serpula lacrymans var. lacrymans S7.9]EGO18427.1 hypothetical protein SERLADRAFT_412247 [Serpula lacrymans var. lacrymans S7.9]